MATVCHLDRAPNETISHILHGSRLDDIVSFALTSFRFYSLVKTTRIVWLNASDNIMLPLPTGHTVRTVPIERLFSLALRAISISKALVQDVAISKRFSHKDLGDSAGDAVPLPGGRWMIYEHDVGLRAHETNGVNDVEQLLVEGDPGDLVTAEALGNGIVRCLRSQKSLRRKDVVRDTISITDIHFPLGTEARPSIVPASSRSINGPYDVCDLHNSLSLSISGDNKDILCLVDPVNRLGIFLEPEGYKESKKTSYSFNEAKFHKHLAKIVLSVVCLTEEQDANDNEDEDPYDPYHGERPEIWLLDIPAFVTRPETSEEVAESSTITWSLVKFAITHRYVVPYDLPMDLAFEKKQGIPESYVCITELRIPPDGLAWCADLIMALCLSPENKLLPVCLGYLEQDWDSTEPTDWTVGWKMMSKDVMAIAFTTLVGRELKRIRLKIPGFGTLWKNVELERFDPVHGQIHLAITGKSLVGFKDPYFVVQY